MMVFDFLLSIGLMCGLVFIGLIAYVGIRIGFIYLDPVFEKIEDSLAK